MNNILFGSIGALMLGIVFLGVAEVRYQSHRIEFAESAQLADVSGVSGDTTLTDISQSEPRGNTAGAGVSQAAAKVEAAYTGNWKSGESEDVGEREDEDEDEDDDDSRTQGVTQSVPANTTATQPAPTATPSNTTTAAGSYTMAQIAQHNTAASCYSAISGNVYDLTSFVSQHPGGASAIKSLCGVDGTAAYNGQHGGSRRPANELASLKIGALAQ